MLTAVDWVGDYAGGNDIIDAGQFGGNSLFAYGGGGADTIKGAAVDDFLWGEAGADTILAYSGNDTLAGGTGADILDGGLGIDNIFLNNGTGGDGSTDIVKYNAVNFGTDFVYDFEHGIDKIDMQGTGANAGTVTITNVGGNAHVTFLADLIVVIGAGATLTTGDILF